MIRLLPLEHPEEFYALRSPSDRRHIVRLVAHLRRAPLAGRPLFDNIGRDDTDGLGGCRSIHARRIRVVYRVLPNERRPRMIQVIAIRHRDDVYIVAAERLRMKRAAA